MLYRCYIEITFKEFISYCIYIIIFLKSFWYILWFHILLIWCKKIGRKILLFILVKIRLLFQQDCCFSHENRKYHLKIYFVALRPILILWAEVKRKIYKIFYKLKEIKIFFIKIGKINFYNHKCITHHLYTQLWHHCIVIYLIWQTLFSKRKFLESNRFIFWYIWFSRSLMLIQRNG